MTSFNLNTLDSKGASNKGAIMVVRHPVSGDPLKTDGENPRPVTITLLGAESDAAEKIQREAQRRRLKKGFAFKLTPEDIETEALNLLAAVTIAWDGIGDENGETPCNADNAKHIYLTIPWIRKQVDEFMGDLSNYLGN